MGGEKLEFFFLSMSALLHIPTMSYFQIHGKEGTENNSSSNLLASPVSSSLTSYYHSSLHRRSDEVPVSYLIRSPGHFFSWRIVEAVRVNGRSSLFCIHM
jgi:hypothetical protein